jgi:hypothetical protein
LLKVDDADFLCAGTLTVGLDEQDNITQSLSTGLCSLFNDGQIVADTVVVAFGSILSIESGDIDADLEVRGEVTVGLEPIS